MMFKNMLKMAWRSALRQKQFSILNILGLSLGITTCLLIGLYVQDELSYDTFQEKADRIYRVEQPMIWGDWNERMSALGPNVGIALRAEAPEFEQVTRLQATGFYIVNHTTADGTVVSFKEDRLYIAEDNFFDVFSFNLLQGNPENVLTGPSKMVITQSVAKKYFGKEDPIGKTMEARFGSFSDLFTISGVVEDLPSNSHIQFDFLTSIDSYEHIKRQDWKWIWTTFATYGLVSPGTDIDALTEKIQSIPPKYAARTAETIFNQSFDDFSGDNGWPLYLTPLTDVYLDENGAGNPIGPVGNRQQIKIFSAIGVLTLLLSCINFMNLSTARSTNRSKEVGIRKVLGSGRRQLISQFIFESLLFTTVSTLIAIVLAEISLNAFNELAAKQLSLDTQLQNPAFIGVLIAFILTVGILSGSYPAFYLSSFKPITSLKGKIISGFKGKVIRNGLVIFQFTISIALIISAFFVQKQLSYASSIHLGYDKENLFQLHNLKQFSGEVKTVKNILASNPAFSAIGHSSALPPNVFTGDRYKATGTEEVVQLSNIKIDEDYFKTLNPKLILGRSFDKDIKNDKYGIVLNASAVKALGWGTPDMYATDSPIGKSMTLASGDEYALNVIGVVEDFNFHSLKSEIGPLVILHLDNDKVWDFGGGVSYLSMRINPEVINSGQALKNMITDIKSEMLALDPTFPFEYSFMDESFDNSFRSEQRMGKVLNVFTAMAIAIACLGLFGLSAFTAEQRKKELGVRKVLGAKVMNLMMLFSTEFTRLVVISLLVATPLSYYIVNSWLADFAYKTPIDLTVFVVTGIAALMIAWLTISFQSLKVAYRNPVDSLRDE